MTKLRKQAYISATRSAQQGESYSDTHVACNVSAKVEWDVRVSKLASLTNKL
ncbi:MAG: hypothetical protein Q7S08_03690 [bacterium]|nr:hypothetical protein [bacterium]